MPKPKKTIREHQTHPGWARVGDVWTMWIRGNTCITCSTTSATATNDLIYSSWLSSTATSASSTTTFTNTYSQWITQGDELNAIIVASNADVRRYAGGRQLSDEERKRYAQKEQERQRQYEEAERLRKEADARAEALLRSHLTPEQIEDLDKKQFFYLDTVGKDGRKRRYRIDRGTHGNVKLMSECGKKIRGNYCVQPDNVPVPDAMLAQVLHIRHNEEQFLQVANYRGWP